jgi:hypothetical protein
MLCTKNNKQTCTLKIDISEIIKYTTELNIIQKTQRALIFEIKLTSTSWRPRMFFPTIDVVVILLSKIGHPRAKDMTPQG